MTSLLIPSLVVTIALAVAAYVVAGWLGVLGAIAAGLLFVSRSMGWIGLLMMHMGPGDEAVGNNDEYESRPARIVLIIAIILVAITVFLVSPTDSAAAVSCWLIGIASTMLVVVRPYERGCTVQLAALAVAVLTALTALILRQGGQLDLTQLILWFLSGAGTGLVARRPVGDDPS